MTDLCMESILSKNGQGIMASLLNVPDNFAAVGKLEFIVHRMSAVLTSDKVQLSSRHFVRLPSKKIRKIIR